MCAFSTIGERISGTFTLGPHPSPMRIANLAGRLTLLHAGGGIDVEKASDGRFPADPQRVYEQWDEFAGWAGSARGLPAEPYDAGQLGSPAPKPSQVFAIGLNYRDHAVEAGFAVPATDPPVFTKFPACVTGPYGEIVLPREGHTDWEVELVAVIGRRAERVGRTEAWSHVAGLAVGQDLSERRSQLAGPSPQFSLAKSFPRFGPIGPWLVSVDEFADPDDLAISASLNGEVVQDGRTGQLIFDVPSIIERLSAVVPLSPGDVIFTGTPAGVGMGRQPQRWLAAGDELVSSIEGIGELRHRFIDQEAPCP
jgi:2-keto-4-pentenoate hydratase/2-oxohepta-3-ene-1,7-dioic acid hydratase in catechol pathway